MNRRSIVLLVAAVALVIASARALAADSDKRQLTVAEMAAYQGADRQERLLEAAKKERGELSVYHVYPSLPVIMTAFTNKYGIKVKAWRSGSEGVLQKLLTEARGGRFDADIVQNNAPENEAAHREKLLQEIKSPYLKDLMPEASPTHKEWTGITVDVYIAAYNTDKVRKEDLPKGYQDLLDPKWKGRLAIEADDQGWFGALAAAMGEKETYKLFADIVASNGISIRKGHSLLTNLVASGEVPLGLTVYSWNPEQLKLKGAPIEGLPLQPVIAQFSTIAMLKKAPHPYTALLFYDFMLSEGQQLLANQNFVPTAKAIAVPITRIPLKFIDPGEALDNQDKWTRAFQTVVTKAAK